MATLLPTIPVPSFTYIGSFVVETEDGDDDDDDVVQSIPPSPIEVGKEYLDDDDDDDDEDDDSSPIIPESSASIEDMNDDPVHESVVDGDYDGNGCCIDHTALLLGDECYYEEEEDDDEREWNVSFSLDELERSNDCHVDKMKEQPPHEIDGDDDELDDDGINYNDFEVQREDGDDYQSCTHEFLHNIGGFATTVNLPAMKSNNTTTSTDVTPTMQRVEPPTRQQHQQVLRHASSLPTAIYSVPPTTYSRTLRRHDTSYILSSSQSSAMIQNDVWRREEEEQQAYATMPRKKINTFENKKKRATMKALAMKERASSALVSRATRAKDILKEKMTNSSRSAQVQDDDNQLQKPHRRSGHEKKMTTMHGNETSTREYDNHTNITSLVSPEVSPLTSSSSLSNLPRTTKKAQVMMSRAISSLSSDTNPPKDIKTSSNNYYGALSQRAHRAKLKALGTMNGVLAAAVSSTSSSTSSNSTSTSSMTRRQQTNDKKTTKQQIIDTVFSIEDEESMSDIPSVLNSEGPSSIQDVSYDGSSIAVVSVRSDGRRNSINSNTAYSTPKMKRGTRKEATGGGREIGLGSSSNRNTMEQSMAASCIIDPSHIYSPEQILANLSNISLPATAVDESCNSIDGDGFLISPSSASIHRRWNEEDGRRGDIVSSPKTAMLPTVGSALSSEGGGSTFDPNSFLFLSPLSDHDLDDPDYGMPFLLSRSNSHNAVVMDGDCTTPTRPLVASGLPPPPSPPPPGPSTMTTTSDRNLSTMKSSSSPSQTMSQSKRLILRFPASPRLVPSPKVLPPSGKKIMKKMKLGGCGGEASSGVIGNPFLNTDRPPLIKNRVQSSAF